jgi:hypothetical protein
MPDLKQEMTDLVQAAVPAVRLPSGKVRLRHPNTGDIKEVDAVPETMIPLMGLGYQQVKE